MLSFDEARLDPVVKIVFGLDLLESFLFLVYKDDVGIPFVLVPLDEVFENIAFADAIRPRR